MLMLQLLTVGPYKPLPSVLGAIQRAEIQCIATGGAPSELPSSQPASLSSKPTASTVLPGPQIAA